jgi:putative ABC transport system permease protein
LALTQGQKLEKDIIMASLRVMIQLVLLGLILGWLFRNTSPVFALIAVLFMTLNSALHSSSRVTFKYPGLFLNNLVSTMLALWPLALLGSRFLNADPWWKMDVLLPLIGMMLGNTLNGLSLGIDHFTQDVREKKEEVFSWLSLGASVKEATRPIFKRSLRLALTPTLNSMLTMGLVSIPGMMTGQLIAGQDPMEAAIIQIIVMFLIASGTYAATFMGLILSQKKLFNERGQLCYT